MMYRWQEASVQLQIKTLHRDQKVLAKMYGLYSGDYYGAKTCPFVQLPL